ncbi:hypothetical protein QBC33DRAFT_530251 [Phialemonium atrogriseum]|uniref:Uncharacterized protein n=1 Tax=Phialemonium atrogriseum TaxID=1093897 RepID=A0AAJ0FPI1_9PEZI|nr:uncharacterized protein QBC33DRAFT_530251 [Phialemonium atrogriseum]KAK1770144.1 hypothetical protein QBC33DRAFT_530251 [Phialemonium atrogriseum]
MQPILRRRLHLDNLNTSIHTHINFTTPSHNHTSSIPVIEMAPSDTTPLVGSPKSPNPTPTGAGPLRPLTAGIITTIGAARIATGVACLAAPSLALRLFSLDLPAPSYYVVRLFGSRELALGTLLLVAKSQGASRDAVRLGVLAGVLTDVVDVVSSVVDLASGNIGMGTFDLGGGVALLLAVLGVVGLRGL